MSKYDVIISGYVSMDRIIKINSPLKTGFTSIVENSDNAKIYYGGCCTNIAYILAKLNKRVLPVIRLGENDIEETGFLSALKEVGVNTDALKIIPEEATSNCYLISDKNRNHITIFYPGAMDGKYSCEIDKKYFENSRFALLTIGSYEDNIEFFSKCCETDIDLIFGMKSDFEGFPVPFLRDILLRSKIIFTNEAERGEIERLYSLSDITDLFNMGRAEIIITTYGKNGSRYYEKTSVGTKSGFVGAAEVGKVIDTTGGGDSYIAGFLYAYLNGNNIMTCCQYASVMSSFIIEKTGCITNAPSEAEFIKRYKEICSL